jgi:hypothetical protein
MRVLQPISDPAGCCTVLSRHNVFKYEPPGVEIKKRQVLHDDKLEKKAQRNSGIGKRIKQPLHFDEPPEIVLDSPSQLPPIM